MKLIFTTLFFCFSLSFGFGQKISSVGPVIGVGSSYRTISIEENVPAGFFRMHTEERNADETAGLNLRLGANINYKLLHNLFFKTGIAISRFRYQGEATTINRPAPFEDETLTWQFVYSHYFLEMPLVLRYEMGSNKFTPYLEAGMVPSIYTISSSFRNTEFLSLLELVAGGNGVTNYVHLFSVASIGVNYKQSEKLQFFAQSSFSYDHVSLEDFFMREHVYAGSLECGVRMMME